MFILSKHSNIFCFVKVLSFTFLSCIILLQNLRNCLCVFSVFNQQNDTIFIFLFYFLPFLNILTYFVISVMIPFQSWYIKQIVVFSYHMSLANILLLHMSINIRNLWSSNVFEKKHQKMIYQYNHWMLNFYIGIYFLHFKLYLMYI